MTLEVIFSDPPAQGDSLRNSHPELHLDSFGMSLTRKSPHLSEQPAQGLVTLTAKKCFLMIKETSVFQFVLTVSGPVTGHH